MLIQFLIFPYACRRYGVLTCLKATAVVFPLLYFIAPFTVLFPTNASRQIAAFILLTAKLCCVVFSFPCNTILLTNSAASVYILGTLNGVATSVSAIGKAVGPAIIGGTFSVGVKHGYMIFPWWVLGFIAGLSAIPVFWAKDQDNFNDEDEEEENDDDHEGIEIENGHGNEEGNGDSFTVQGAAEEDMLRNEVISCGGNDGRVKGRRTISSSPEERNRRPAIVAADSDTSARIEYWTVDDPPPPPSRS